MPSPYLKTERHYRKKKSSHKDEQKFNIVIEETDLLITISSFVNLETAVSIASECVQKIRDILKEEVLENPPFLNSLVPISYIEKTENLITAMNNASKHANVGPFAAVAGSVSQLVGITLVVWLDNLKTTSDNPDMKNSQINVIVENGGDTYLYSEKERTIGILSDPKQKEQIGLFISSQDFPTALCSSSATIGHSLSLGKGDIAMVRAKNAPLADALATAYCNMLKTSKDINLVIERAQKDAQILCPENPFSLKEIIEFLQSCQALPTNYIPSPLVQQLFTKNSNGAVEGVFLQCDGHIGAWGNIELIAL